MEQLKCIIVDDDGMAGKIIEQLCLQAGSLDIQGIFENSTDAFRFLTANKIDLVFLDIEMPGMSGIDLVKLLQDKPRVIFVTGHSGHAVEAFDLEVIDYLVKPIEYPRFLKAIRKVTDSLMKNVSRENEHIFIKSEGIFHKVGLDEIIHIEAQGDYISIHTAKKRITIYDTLKSIESKLSSKFLRVHRSFIINQSYIISIEDNCISLPGGALIPIGVSYRPQVSKTLGLS